MKVRLPGLVLLGLCAVAFLRLHQLVIAAPLHQATGVELLLGLLTVLCGSAGAAMTVLGPKLFEQVPVPVRTRRFDPLNDD